MKNLLLLSKKVDVFIKLTIKEKVLLLEALLLSGLFRALMLTMPFKKFRKLMGHYNKENDIKLTESNYKTIWSVRWAVLLVSRHTPWKSECLVQALTAQKMLKKRNLISTIHLGLGRDIDKSILAHAWLKCGSLTVTGESKDGFFKEVAKFS